MKWRRSKRRLERYEQEIERLRNRIDGPRGLTSQLVASRKSEQMEFRGRKKAERRAKDLQEALEALIDVQPYLHPNPNSLKAKEWEGRKERALDQAATALSAGTFGGYRVK